MNYIILDLEATCWNERSLRNRNEIIEIGALKVNEKGKILNEFSAFIKPKLNPFLSNFCTELTTITQNEIDHAETYDIVVEQFKNWINLNETYLLCSWGFYDKNQFTKDDELHELDSNWLQNHISLKHQYSKINNLKRPCGMKQALKKEGIKLEGTHHRGIDDARNITKIFLAHFGKWDDKIQTDSTLDIGLS